MNECFYPYCPDDAFNTHSRIISFLKKSHHHAWSWSEFVFRYISLYSTLKIVLNLLTENRILS